MGLYLWYLLGLFPFSTSSILVASLIFSLESARVPTIIPVSIVAIMLIDIPAIMLIEYVTSPFNSLDLKDSPKIFYYITHIHPQN